MALGPEHYVTLAGLQTEGVIAAGVDITDPTDPAVVRAEQLARQAARAVDRFCRSWFWDRTYGSGTELYVDGKGGEVLHLPAPIISVQRVELDYTDTGSSASWTEVPLASLAVYSDPRDWQNPKLARKRATGLSVWTGNAAAWPTGRKNIRLRCHLGHLEDGATPIAIQRAVMRLVDVERELVADDYGAQARALRGARVKSQTTHNRSVTYMDHILMGAFTGDPLVDNALARYRRPFA